MHNLPFAAGSYWRIGRPGACQMSGITTDQRTHREGIVKEFLPEFRTKYTRGAIEHVGLLSDCSAEQLINMAIEEVQDMVSYLYTLRAKLKERSIE